MTWQWFNCAEGVTNPIDLLIGTFALLKAHNYRPMDIFCKPCGDPTGD